MNAAISGTRHLAFAVVCASLLAPCPARPVDAGAPGSFDNAVSGDRPGTGPIPPRDDRGRGTGDSGLNVTRSDLPAIDPTDQRPSLTFWIFLHDDAAGASRQHVHAGYVSWWIADLQRLLPHHRLRIYYRERRSGVTDIAYGDKATSMRQWVSAATDFRTRTGLPWRPNEDEHKFMLVTRHLLAPSTMGLALPEGDHAMVSLAGPWSVVAHEFGHTLGAVHADAAIGWSYAWPCGTNLYPTNHRVLPNCYRYTEANERRIVDYLGVGPGDQQADDPASMVE